MRINHNIPALQALFQYNKTNSNLEKALEKLSSGKRINRAADDAAGMAISNKLDAQIRGLEQANRNSYDGISLIQTAEGALSEVEAMLQRMRELSVQACNGTLATEDREAVQKEVDELTEEIERVSTDMEFNEMKLLNGDLDHVTFSNEPTLAEVVSMSDAVEPGSYTFDISTLGVIDNFVGDFPLPMTSTQNGNQYELSGQDGFKIVIENDAPPAALTTVTIDVLEAGPLDIHIGANEGQSMQVRLRNMSPKALGIDQLDVLSTQTAGDALAAIDEAVETVSKVRAQLGAYQNRLEYTINSLSAATENMTASLSRILDADMAVEMANYTQLNVISQSGVSMIAQANQMPEQVLQLLRG